MPEKDDEKVDEDKDEEADEVVPRDDLENRIARSNHNVQEELQQVARHTQQHTPVFQALLSTVSSANFISWSHLKNLA